MSASTPAAGAGTSSTTLSVSMSTRISSACTASPGCFFHGSSLASATDSESCGTTTSSISRPAGAGTVLAAASVSSMASTCSAVTVAPLGWRISASTPAAGAGTSSTTLSVSISTRISPACTASPGCFFQGSSLASATDSESCGTLTSTMAIIVFLNVRENVGNGFQTKVQKSVGRESNAACSRCLCCSWCRRA